MRAFGQSLLGLLGVVLVIVGGGALLLALVAIFSAGGGLSTFGGVCLYGGPVIAVIGIVLVRRESRPSTDEPSGEEERASGAVYAVRPRFLLLASFGFPLLAVVALSLGLVSFAPPVGVGSAIFGAGCITVALGSGWLSVRSFTLRRHQDPYFLVDSEGIECKLGRFSWQDVSRVVEVTDRVGESSSHVVVFRLHEGATPQPAGRAYSEGYVEWRRWTEITPYGLELRINECREQAHSALRSVNRMPEEVERKWLTTTDAATPPEPTPRKRRTFPRTRRHYAALLGVCLGLVVVFVIAGSTAYDHHVNWLSDGMFFAIVVTCIAGLVFGVRLISPD